MRTRLKVLSGIFVFILMALPAWSQSDAPTVQDVPAIFDRIEGTPSDWSHQHAIFSKPSFSPTSGAEFNKLRDIEAEPRFWIQALHRSDPRKSGLTDSSNAVDHAVTALRTRAQAIRNAKPKPPPAPKPLLSLDWNAAAGVVLNTPAVVTTYPAKFTYFGTAPSCNDWVVYTIPIAGSASQFNLIAYKNLYTGCTGIPTVKFTYNASSPGATNIAGPLRSSSVISLDGTKIAFLENGSSKAVFHVLQLPSSDTGVVGTFPIPNPTTTPLTACPQAAGTLCISSLQLSALSTISAPFVDYNTDTAYVGDDNGNVYVINPVFGGTPAITATIATTAARVMTPPVFDPVSSNLFVADTAGKVSFIRTQGGSPGSCVSGSPPCLGSTSFSFTGSPRIADAPIVDVSTGSVFVFGYGTISAVTGSWVVQLNTTLGTVASVVTGANPSVQSVYDGAFDDTYFTTPTSGHLIACGGGASGEPVYTQFGFAAGPTITTTGKVGPAAFSAASSAVNCSPITENVGAGTDRIFLGVQNNCGSAAGWPVGGCIESYALPLTGRGPFAGTTGNGSSQNVLTSATASFTAGDVGKFVVATPAGWPVTPLPAGEVITVFTNSTTVTISPGATGNSGAGSFNIFSGPASTPKVEPGGVSGIIIDNTVDTGSGVTAAANLYFTTLSSGTSCPRYGTTNSTSFSCLISLLQAF